MKKVLFLLMSVMPLMAIAQNFDGDWSGSWYSSYAKKKIPIIIHISEGICSEEPSVASSSSYKEVPLEMVIEEDVLSLYEQVGKKPIKFEGRLVKGKLQGEYYVSGQAYKVTLTKVGKGKVSLQAPYKADRSSGIVIY